MEQNVKSFSQPVPERWTATRQDWKNFSDPAITAAKLAALNGAEGLYTLTRLS